MTIETASLPLAEGQMEARHAIDDLLGAFEAFKQANDDRLSEIEQKQSADVLLEEKVDRINTQISQLNTLAQRPAMARQDGGEDIEAKAAFEKYVRGQAMPEERKAAPDQFATTSHSALVLPDYLETRLNEDMMASSILIRLANKREVESTASVKWVAALSDTKAKWVGEAVPRPKTEAPELQTYDIQMNELYANPVATQRFIDDSAVDVEAWIMRTLSDAFAEAETEAFFDGNGANKPLGLLQAPSSYSPTDQTLLKYIKTGAKAAFPAENPTDVLLTTMFALKPGYRKNAVWMMNASVIAEIRKMKDKSGGYIWSPSMQLGEAPSLFGYPLYEEPRLSDLVNNKLVAAFGDFGRAYMIIRHPHTQLIRDPYSEKPFVQFYATRRVGGYVVDREAYVALQATT